MNSAIPDGWHVQPLGKIADPRRGITYSAEMLELEADGLPYINMKSFLKGGGFNPEGTKRYAGSYGQDDLIGERDLLIANTDVTAGDIVGAPALIPQELMVEKLLYSHHVTRLRLNGDVTMKFLYYLLCLPKYRSHMLRVARGTTVLMLDMQAIKRIPICAPKLDDEQFRIAEILSTLDETIEQTEALIAKYQQIKAGLMHDLFTRGVTPDGRLRAPRTEAPQLYKETPLGWIPVEWDVVPLSTLVQSITSGSRGWATFYSETGALFLRISNLTREHINFRWDNITRVSLPKFSEGQRTAVQPNDILISITADLGIVAVAHQSLGEAYVNQHIALVRPLPNQLSSRYLGHFLTTMCVQKQFIRLNDSGAKAGLNLPAVGKILVARPQLDEEASEIASKVDACDRQIECYKTEVSKLHVQKQGLMHDLLSGQVAVKVPEVIAA
jgi:type I restriction enzyme, S subunit